MSYYARNIVFVAIETPATPEMVAALDRQINDLNERAKGVQRNRALRDIETAKEYRQRMINGEKIGFVKRQYTGHKYQPERVDGKYDILFIGEYCWW